MTDQQKTWAYVNCSEPPGPRYNQPSNQRTVCKKTTQLSKHFNSRKQNNYVNWIFFLSLSLSVELTTHLLCHDHAFGKIWMHRKLIALNSTNRRISRQNFVRLAQPTVATVKRWIQSMGIEIQLKEELTRSKNKITSKCSEI